MSDELTPATATATLAETLTAKSTGSNASPGYKTTEFWAHVVFLIGLLLAACVGVLPPQWAAICAAASQVAYSFSRGLSKQGNSN